jgi:Na+/H+-dicarboxylate symporter
MQNHQTPDTLTPSSFLTNFIQNTLINPFKAFSEGNVLAVVVFALFLGVALVKGGERFNTVRQLSQQFFEMMMMLVSWVMKLAPLGIFALLAKLIATEDLSVLSRLAEFAFVDWDNDFSWLSGFTYTALDFWKNESSDVLQRCASCIGDGICNKL